MFVCLQSLGTKVTLHLLPTLQNNELVPQVLKQVVNLSGLHGNFKSCVQINTFKAIINPAKEKHFMNVKEEILSM